MSTDPPRPFPHHRLRVWHHAISFVELCSKRPPDDAELRNHALRAAKSVALNTAEGSPLTGRARKRFFRIARASLVEVVAAYEIAHTLGDDVPLLDVMKRADEIYAILTKLMQYEGEGSR